MIEKTSSLADGTVDMKRVVRNVSETQDARVQRMWCGEHISHTETVFLHLHCKNLRRELLSDKLPNIFWCRIY